MSGPGMWVDGTDLHFFDASGVEWSVTGTAGPSGGHPGIFINSQGILTYVDATGVTRTVPYVSAPGGGKDGALWIDAFVHWIVGGQVYNLHADVAYTDATYSDHSDRSVYTDATPVAYTDHEDVASYGDFSDHADYTDTGTYQDYHSDGVANTHHDTTVNYTDNSSYGDSYADSLQTDTNYWDGHADEANYSDYSTHTDVSYPGTIVETGTHYDYSSYLDYSDSSHNDVAHSDAPTKVT